MKWIIPSLTFFALFSSAAQKTDFLPQISVIEYRYHLRFEPGANTKIIPYHAQWYKVIPLNGDSTTLEYHENNTYWFDYAPRVPAIYQDGFLDHSKWSMYWGLYMRVQLNCTKIINSKGEEAYIYFTTVNGPDSLEQMNPCLAFDGIENGNTPDYWDPVGFLNDTILSISCTDLEKGTYFFNWFDPSDSLNIQLSALWQIKLRYENEQRGFWKKNDSLQQLFRRTGNRDFLTQAYHLSMNPVIINQYEQQKKTACKNIMALGYASEAYFNKTQRLKTEIRKEALVSHRIDGHPVSPADLNKYLALPRGKRPKTVQKILAVLGEE